MVDTAIAPGVTSEAAEEGFSRYADVLMEVMVEGVAELARDQAAYPGAAHTVATLAEHGYIQTALTGNLRVSAEFKLAVAGLDSYLDLDVGSFGSDARHRRHQAGVAGEWFTDPPRCGVSLRSCLVGSRSR
ncbi:hypothetical protein ACFU44_20585 [Nocardia rhizosphaerihabitans]|uniref:hypothetical protein n=1 Tax=Nocardia rhizosphaerihabitans TaxID=1691570 RepID=UPI00366B74DE